MVFNRQDSDKGHIYDGLSDEEIVRLANEGDLLALEHLIYKYKDLVKVKAKVYYIVGADRDDIIQEGMIGLYKAIRDYREERTSSFRNFADICVTRQMITAIKTATRQKHLPLNGYISLNKPVYRDGTSTMAETVTSGGATDPMDLFIGKEDLDDMEQKINSMLSNLERQVLTFYVEGRSYEEIALDLNRRVKTIDNALQRIKRKIERYLVNKE
ncbi:RNA polymerase sporulation sigma factor SigH [Gudongella sp. DL1XJH-153]|uniref:RNA polymerase sporulation sigma factor SigH n=1 Tax=Gudongella sp. DL1XJH-153 TaxID=3409804 RepID=UPI003BB75BC0